MTDLDTLLDQNIAPTARESLSARILAAAETAQPANDIASRRPWWSIGAVAAMAVMATFFLIQGFTDLYEWVEGADEEPSEAGDG